MASSFPNHCFAYPSASTAVDQFHTRSRFEGANGDFSNASLHEESLEFFSRDCDQYLLAAPNGILADGDSVREGRCLGGNMMLGNHIAAGLRRGTGAVTVDNGEAGGQDNCQRYLFRIHPRKKTSINQLSYSAPTDLKPAIGLV